MNRHQQWNSGIKSYSGEMNGNYSRAGLGFLNCYVRMCACARVCARAHAPGAGLVKWLYFSLCLPKAASGHPVMAPCFSVMYSFYNLPSLTPFLNLFLSKRAQ